MQRQKQGTITCFALRASLQRYTPTEQERSPGTPFFSRAVGVEVPPLPGRSLLFGEGGEAGFADLQDYAGVAVGYFADTVLGGGAEDLGYFGGGELVVVGEPVGHVVGGVFEGVVEIAAVA